MASKERALNVAPAKYMILTQASPPNCFLRLKTTEANRANSRIIVAEAVTFHWRSAGKSG